MIKKKIINEIKKNKKAISLEKFINICLFDKEGYYSNDNIIGRSGDFITAPEVSQLYGEILGLYIYSIWKKKFNSNINFIELGPGNGTLMSDILRITKSFSNFHNSIECHLIEKNNYFKKKQKKNLDIFKKVNFNWHKKLSKISKKPSIIIANEFFDCLPIRQFKKKNNIWFEICVNYKKKEDRFYYEDLLVNNKKILKKLSKLKNTNISELSFERESYFEKICKFLLDYSGIIIIVDYGYYEQARNFTLQTIYNHKKSNLLDNIGKQDISSFVDFKSFINLSNNYNLNINTYCKQKDFLLSNGILERKNKITQNCNLNDKKIIEKGFKKLIDENEMGSLFKFLILSQNI